MAHRLRAATAADVPAIHALMQELAEYEKLTHLFIATPHDLHDALFGAHPAAECLECPCESLVGTPGRRF